MAKILVIDDEAEIRQVLKELLEREGHEIEIAPDGEEAISAFRNTSPDIVLVDIVMPRKDGVGVIREIRKENSSVKIIAISGGGKLNSASFNPETISTTVYLAAADAAGADRTLPKPFNKEEILSAIRALG